MTVIAPDDYPWSCRATWPPGGQAMSQASNSRVEATSLHFRSPTTVAPGQRSAGASRRATVAGSTETAAPVLAKVDSGRRSPVPPRRAAWAHGCG